jgi:hypothetical protein
MLKNFVLPSALPQRKILSVDIGGTLTKAAFYVPKDDPIRLNSDKYKKIIFNSIPSKFNSTPTSL